MSKVTVYQMYLKKDNSLYAITTDKDERDLFLSQRNAKCFICKKDKFKSSIIKKILDDKFAYRLREIPLNISLTTSINILATANEEEYLYKMADDMDNRMIDISNELLLNGYSKKYMNAISYLSRTTYIHTDGCDRELMSKINLFSLFRETYKDTFYVSTNDEDID